eukprot:2038782-Prymnesium_polylepis.1
MVGGGSREVISRVQKEVFRRHGIDSGLLLEREHTLLEASGTVYKGITCKSGRLGVARGGSGWLGVAR